MQDSIGARLPSHELKFKRMTNPSGTPHPLIQKVLADKPPIAKLIGFVIEEIGDGRAVGSMEAGPQHANPMGTLHGGILCDLADAAMGMAFASTLAADEGFTTVSLNITFFRPVWKSQLRAEARVTNRGRNVGYIECDIADQNGKRIATANSTCFILRGEGQGREKSS
jgi:uncharacterized protein (TIGR00369 family)